MNTCSKEPIHSKFAAIHKIAAIQKKKKQTPGLTWCLECKTYHLKDKDKD